MKKVKFFLVLISCAWLAGGPGLCLGQDPAQTTLSQAESMPDWIVPVLRLVSATHVEPTTGVVISSSGLVLLADDFASTGDEIIVLDGGTDIIRNGRPAKIEHRFPAQGLMILSVESLHRNAVQFTTSELADGDTISLRAFPPAKMIEQGAPPLDVSTTVNILPESKFPVLSSDSVLPNVTGPLIDACGNLAGYSSADGVQSMSTSEATRYHWKSSLLAILRELQIEIIENSCTPPTTAPDTPVEAEPEPVVELPDETEKPAEEAVAEEPDAESDDEEVGEDEPVPDEESLAELDVLPPFEELTDHEPEEAVAAGDEESSAPAWAWLLASVLLLGSAFALHKVRNRETRSQGEKTDADQTPPAQQQDNEDEPAFSAPGLDCLLIIDGILSDGTEFSQSCKVSQKAINIVIGRGNADINIASNAISRKHVCLNGSSEMLTITDLGASNGTSINGIPCLEGETMFIEPEDIIILGNARFSYRISAADTQKDA